MLLQITNKCHMMCPHCLQDSKPEGNHMTLETFNKVLQFMLYCGINYVTISGGEPTEHPDIEKICQVLHNHKIHFSICSNGIDYFNPKFQNLLKKYGNEISFSISIDGTKKLHDACRIFPDGRGSYDIAIQGVKHYMEHYNKNLDSKMTLAPANLKYLYESFYNLVAIGYK